LTLPAGLDVEVLTFLERHEARVHAFPGRDLRDLGHAVLLTDPANRDPFWNRLSAIRWPSDPEAFDDRLADMVTLFATFDRVPHVWPRMAFKEPADLVERLVASGFRDMGKGHVMVLADESPIARAAAAIPAGATIERFNLVSPAERHDPARILAEIAADAFEAPGHQESLARETAALFDRPEVHVVLVRVDGRPAAIAKRATFDGASYLSSIGTGRSFRGRGLGRLVTAVVTADALAARSRWVHLGVFEENVPALRLYRSLGFTTLGEAAPDLLLLG
jgi:GNAT superfamily N-acetyltransferase